jgi:DNA-binding NarL/FixJ family response regulator
MVWILSAVEDPSNSAFKIYVVEDSPILRRLVMELLGAIEGVRMVGHADTAEVAVAEILERAPDAVIVDIMLTSGTGFDVMKAVHQTDPPPLLIVLSNFISFRYRNQAKELGATYFFDKSTEIVQLVHVIKQRVDSHRRRADPTAPSAPTL